MKKKRTLGSADKLLLFALLSLLAALTALFVSLIQSVQSQKKICQSIISLGKYEYNALLLEQAEKISGLRSITPVCEASVTLKTDGYTMDAVLIGVDISELLMNVKDAQEAALGNVPALLIGEKSLSGLRDANGNTASEKKQREILENYRELTWEYCLSGTGTEISGSVNVTGAVQSKEGESSKMAGTGTQDDGMSGAGIQSGGLQNGVDTGAWKPCAVAAILSRPEKDIYIPYHQATALLAGAGDVEGSKNVTKILLTVQGEKNYEKAAGLFE